MRKIVAAAALIAASVGTAHAASFDFGYTTQSGINAQGKLIATDTGFGTYAIDNIIGARSGVGITGYDYDDLTPQSFTYSNGFVTNVDFSYYIGANNYELRFPGGNNSFGTEFRDDGTGSLTSLLVTSFSLRPTPVVSAVPEPAAWAMMIVGFGAVGFGLRHRRKVAVRVSYAV